MDIRRNELTSDTDERLDIEASAREKFLLHEGLELLAMYRKIGDPALRCVVRRLVAAEGQVREQ